MNQYLSKKIKYISFFAMIGVVFCHAYNYINRFLQPTTVLAEGPNPGTMLQFFISNGLVRFGVPIFFAFSGYLFFVSFEFSWKGYLTKVLKRIRTLVLPYFIWTALAGGLLYWVYLEGGLYKYSIVYERVGIVLLNGVQEWILNSPAFQLWYILDLFKLVLISPLIYFLVKKCKVIPVIVFTVLWALEISFVINCEGLLFFTLGSYLAVNKIKLPGMESLENEIHKTKYKNITTLFTVLWVAGCFFYSLMSGTLGNTPYISYILWALYKVNVITGLIAVWRLYDVTCGKWQDKKPVKAAVASTVFVYFAHEPLLHLLTDVLLNKWKFNGEHTLAYFMLSLGLIVIFILVGTLLRKICPKVYAFLTGGR